MRVLITGISGLLGPHIANNFLSEGVAPENILGVYHSTTPSYQKIPLVQLDLTSKVALAKLAEQEFDVIVHCAACTNVDLCEDQPHLAKRLNVDMTNNLVSIAKRSSAKLVYISSESIFHEQIFPDETTKPNPLSVYAKTKFEGEEVVRNAKISHLILRTTIFGPSLNNQKKLFESLLENLTRGTDIFAFCDNTFNPISTDSFAKILGQLLIKKCSGTFHVNSDECMSRFSFSMLFALIFEKNRNFIKPILVKNLNLRAPRSRLATLNNSKVKEILGLHSVSLIDQLKVLHKLGG